MQITGCVITFNEQARIAACLRSLAVCDELLVVDSRSTDRTRDIAAGAGARVIERDWPGYRSQKQFAIEAAAHDWVLVLDADETLSPALAGEIETLRRRGPGEFAGFSMPRRWIYFGRELRFGDAGRDRHVRLFDRRRTRFGGHEVHERAVVRGPVGRLSEPIMHDSYRDLADQRAKLTRYARLMSEALYAEGRRASAADCPESRVALPAGLPSAPRRARWLAGLSLRAARCRLRAAQVPVPQGAGADCRIPCSVTVARCRRVSARIAAFCPRRSGST